MSNIINLEHLSQHYICNSYQEVDENYFHSGQYFSFSEVYCFTLDVYSRDFPFYRSEKMQSDAMVFKFDNIYYLTAIDNEDGYRSHVGPIFQLSMSDINKKGLINFLEINGIHNQIDYVIDIEAHSDEKKSNKGVLFSMVDYSTTEAILSLMTYDSDDYYPHGVIEFDAKLYLKSIPIIEQKLLNETLALTKDSKIKVKL